MIKNTELKLQDPEVYDEVVNEYLRQETNIELIASENFVSNAVREAMASVFTNKYAEGYPGKRYYGGCEYVDRVENLAIERAKKLFNCQFANVQAHSGSSANMAAYRAILSHGDRLLGMGLDSGGHLSHGYKLSFSGQDYEAYSYDVDPVTGLIDYEKIREQALEVKPKLIVCGASAYPRIIDFKKFREIADEVGAYLIADIAHIAGLVATGLHPSPFPYCDIVTSTTQKTLRGPRGGLILTNNEELYKKINKAIFPACQGGPLENTIAAKAVCFKEDLDPSFKKYMEQVLKNSRAMAEYFMSRGVKVITGGTDNHLFLIDVKSSFNMTGLEAQKLLEKCNITCNKNAIPGDTERPAYASGIRIGTPAMTTRGFDSDDFVKVAKLIVDVLSRKDDSEFIQRAHALASCYADMHPLTYEEPYFD